jgi:hypothetical protein
VNGKIKYKAIILSVPHQVGKYISNDQLTWIVTAEQDRLEEQMEYLFNSPARKVI